MAKSNGAANNDAANSSSPPDFTSLMDFSRFMPNGKMPGFDLEAAVLLQRRNAETLTQAGQSLFAGWQAMMRRQGEMMREGWQEAAGLMGEALRPCAPEEKMAKQTEAAKNAFEKCVANSRELAELAAKTGSEAAQTVTTRVTEALDELRDVCARR